ncbi:MULTISPECIES: YceI family protein [Myroides]|uniref:YceI family protein n=1 Tax=Myroides albus TaxID=2562892 RepID=A0A6I3LL19_9FLAO|nr:MULTISPECIES: YceI family protein [Myroides]MTG98417.1 YceI family protein [Myroides albus]MVX36839.1 YceI family protein [Myroides sp. LoEW2-1]UVD79670.1 YceI family protein [Myroides albus]
MKKSLLAIALVAAFATSCGEKKQDTKDVQDNAKTEQVAEANYTYGLEWTAFKTPGKVGVKGQFKDIKLIDANASAATVTEGLSDAKFVVVTSSVFTNDAGRDEKLKMEFFAKMLGNINGYFGEFKDGKVVVNITMNGISKEKEFSYEEKDGVLKLNGAIDILADFSANTAFDSLHEACKDLHEGKTWSDVELSIEIKK